MTHDDTQLPWYLNFSNLFIGAGVIGAGVLGWFALGQPGLPPQDGEYSCLQASSFESWERAEERGYPAYVYDPFEDQYGARLEGGDIVEAQVYPGSDDGFGPGDWIPASSYSFGSKKSPTTFTATIEGVRVGCHL